MTKDELDNFIEKVSDTVLQKLSDRDKRYMKNHPDPVYYHMSLGLATRNEFIWGTEFAEIEDIHPDDISNKIIELIIEKIK